MGWLSCSYEFDSRAIALYRRILGAVLAFQVIDLGFRYPIFLTDAGFAPR